MYKKRYRFGKKTKLKIFRLNLIFNLSVKKNTIEENLHIDDAVIYKIKKKRGSIIISV